MQDYYYSSPHVRARMLEFLGGGSPGETAALYVTGGDRDYPQYRRQRPTEEILKLWEQDLDIGRSVWDRKSLIADLDIEYVNFDFPAEGYLAPERAFGLQAPVESIVEAALLEYGIRPLHLLSGRGHHFVWRIRQESRVFRRLAALSGDPSSLEELYRKPHGPGGEFVPIEVGAAYAGLGMVIEYLAHRIKEIAAPVSQIPLELTAVEVGPQKRGREMISIDISEYGDPLHARVLRIPFSRYFKPWQQRQSLGEQIVEKMADLFVIPLQQLDFKEGIQLRQDAKRVVELAEHTAAEIPDASEAMHDLVSAYEESSLARFHQWFYAEEHHPPAAWPSTYDKAPLETIPPCARYMLEHPNDLLLRPGGIERVVRVFLSLGWHPRHIAGLIRSKFERDYCWAEQWQGYDPATRADFYTRIFAGLFAVGRDDLVDFNCQSAKEEKLCFFSECPDNLEQYKNSLLDRRTYERLARGPFHRLFLPEEHL